jgi:hypothetical protein
MNKVLQLLFNQFVKQYGRKPNNLETILLKQKAMNEALDKRKVISMVDRQPVDPNRPIMGGTQEVTEDTGKGFIDFVRKTDPEGAAKLQKTEDEIRAAIEAGNKRAAENLRKKKSKKLDDPEEKAYGGRIGLKEGEGIMQMASIDNPFYRDDEGDRDEHSYRMFNKPYKELNEGELEDFREEMMRLMNKFSSAPDPMDERNTVMENIAIDQFGKPLKDLSEEEIIQIEEMMDEMSIKKDRGAPSIKLAAEGGIMRVGLKDGVLKRGLKAITDTDTYKTLEDKGFNTAVGLKYAFDEVFNILQSGIPGLAEGGRIGYKEGPPDPTKRKFMKTALGIASMIPGVGMLAKGAKVAAPVVTKAAELTGPALAKIVETVMDFGKLISVKGRRVKEMVTKKKHQGVEVTEDISDGSYIIKKDKKEIYYKPGRMDETGGVEDDIIEILEDTVTKKAGGGIARMLGE